MRVVLDSEAAARGLRRMAGEIVERHRGTEGLLLVGIRRGGVPVARELARWIQELEGHAIPVGSVDITFYRDDAATALPSPRIGPSEIPISLQGARVILVDDVVFTGRTIRAALDAILDYGRPSRIELAALVDRGGREFPIQPDYVVRTLDVPLYDRVDVLETTDGLRAIVQSASTPTSPPPRP